MDIEQCIEMMKALSRLYKNASESINIPEINKLKHVLTEIEMYISSIRKSMDTLNKRGQIDKKIKIDK